jgi:PAS domain S-box-containing protein
MAPDRQAGMVTATAPALPGLAPGRQPPHRSDRPIIIGTVLVVIAIVAITAGIIWERRENTLASAQEEITKLDRVLAEQTARTFDSVDIVVASLAEEQRRGGITSAVQFQREKSGRETYDELRKRLSGLPQLDALSFDNAEGDVFSFTRSYPPPAPPISVADRDYFTALRDNPQLERFISEPVQTRDGTATWIITLARPIRAKDGSLVGLIHGSIQLRYFEDFYRDISLGNGSAIALFREDGTLLVRYPNASEIVGKAVGTSRDFGQMLGHAPSALIRISSPAYAGGPFVAALGRVPKFPLIVSVTLSEDSLFARWRFQAIIIAAAGMICAVTVCLIAWLIRRHLGAHAQMEQVRSQIENEKVVQVALRESQDRLNRAQRVARTGSAERNLVTGEIYWSEETYRIYGVDPATFTPSRKGRNALIVPEDRERIQAMLDGLGKGIRHPPTEYRIIRPDGETRWLYHEHEPIFDESGKPVRVVSTIRDITEQRLTEHQLAQAQKMEAIGNLTGGMAHDFNNLLGVIIGNLGLLRDEPSRNPADDELLKDAFDAALRGADLTRRLLAFARRQPLQPRLVQVNDLVQTITTLLRRTLGEHIEISLDLGTALWLIRVDPAQFEAAITNLSTNARDAMPDGGKLMIRTANVTLDELYVAQHAAARPGDYVVIEIADTGTGMSSQVEARIFEPFFTTKEVGKGTGLGLSMVFGFINQSGGHIHVYSELGEGTCFRLYLPRADQLAEEIVSDGSETTAVTGGSERVLVVEDNEQMRRVLVKQLNELGYRVVEAPDAPRALELLGAGEVDLLFTDIVMPGELNGAALAKEARRIVPRIKVLFTSGFPESRAGAGGWLGANDKLLNKPYRKDELARALRQVLDAPGAGVQKPVPAAG